MKTYTDRLRDCLQEMVDACAEWPSIKYSGRLREAVVSGKTLLSENVPEGKWTDQDMKNAFIAGDNGEAKLSYAEESAELWLSEYKSITNNTDKR